MDDLFTGGAPDNGIIDNQYFFIFEYLSNGIELAAHRGFALMLIGHDKCPVDISILDKTFPVCDAQTIGQFEGRG